MFQKRQILSTLGQLSKGCAVTKTAEKSEALVRKQTDLPSQNVSQLAQQVLKPYLSGLQPHFSGALADFLLYRGIQRDA